MKWFNSTKSHSLMLFFTRCHIKYKDSNWIRLIDHSKGMHFCHFPSAWQVEQWCLLKSNDVFRLKKNPSFRCIFQMIKISILEPFWFKWLNSLLILCNFLADFQLNTIFRLQFFMRKKNHQTFFWEKSLHNASST